MADAKFINKARILARLRRMPPVVEASARDELKAQVEKLVEAERRACPTGSFPNRPAGELRDSIAADEVEGRVIAWRVVAWARDEKGRLYGRYVEFGHTAADGSFVAAQPFWFATYRAWRAGMVRAVRARVRRDLKAQFREFSP